jgi:hypothetical protein
MVSRSKKGNRVQVMGYYTPAAVRRLLALSKATRIPQAVLLREALDDLLAKRATKK